MRLFPILGVGGPWSEDLANDLRKSGIMYAVVGVPWEMIAPHEKRCLENHGQTIEHLTRRGGISAEEAVAVIEGRTPRQDAFAWKSHQKLAQMVDDWIKGENE